MWRLDIFLRDRQEVEVVTSKLTILSLGSRDISEISWTKSEELRICEEVCPVYAFRTRARYWAVLLVGDSKVLTMGLIGQLFL